MPDTPIRLLIADDQALVRGALTTLLNLEPDIEVVAQASTGAEALSAVEQLNGHVDVIVMDIEMPVMDGITASAQLLKRWPHLGILMVTTFGRPGYLQRCMAAGARGFMVKDSPVDELTKNVRIVAAGGKVIDPELAIESLSVGSNPLTEREIEALRVSADGGTIADIARTLGISQGTTRNHISMAMIKTSARTRADAVRIATEQGWL
ncbi:response regulator transcription factor [Collinsella sp. zg1085]|uniref:response regulator transcription factor n=1 Tax=Collinsella sp. zg1085 TaxID=2844380 RepID=UPI001C0C9923|nr:response regulator transcription factor [Collinsella sp. zg1085]QWT17328.1 response regulator transcription factor [Collinsella sp. zg1085]